MTKILTPTKIKANKSNRKFRVGQDIIRIDGQLGYITETKTVDEGGRKIQYCFIFHYNECDLDEWVPEYQLQLRRFR